MMIEHVTDVVHAIALILINDLVSPEEGNRQSIREIVPMGF